MASSRQTPRLAVGEFDGGQVVTIARRLFLSQLRERIPQVSEQLRDEALGLLLLAKNNSNSPALSTATVAGRRQSVIEGTINSQEIAALRKDLEKGRYDADKHFSAFLRSIFDWTKRWNIEAEWCLFRALKTLNSWSRYKPLLDDLQWSLSLSGLDNPEGEPQPPVGFPAWNVFDDSNRVYKLKVENCARQRIVDDPMSQAEKSHREAFIRSLLPTVLKYQDTVISFYREKGFKPVNRKELIKHMKWTVDFQVAGETFKGIARDSRVEPQAVTKAVKAVLQLIELKQRVAPIGRPPGTKDSGTRRIVRRSPSR